MGRAVPNRQRAVRAGLECVGDEFAYDERCVIAKGEFSVVKDFTDDLAGGSWPCRATELGPDVGLSPKRLRHHGAIPEPELYQTFLLAGGLAPRSGGRGNDRRALVTGAMCPIPDRVRGCGRPGEFLRGPLSSWNPSARILKLHDLVGRM